MVKLTAHPFRVLLGVSLIFSLAFGAKNELLEKAKQAAKKTEWENAAELAKQAVVADGGNEEAWSVLGESQIGLGDTVNAIESYKKALDLNAKQPNAVLALTALYIKENKMDEAEAVVARAEEKDPRGKLDEIKVARAQILAKQGGFAEATKILTSATQKNPKNPLYPQILARLYNDNGVKVLAEQYYGNAWALASGDPVLAYEYALVLQDLQKYNEALALFKQVQEKDPDNESVDYNIGRLYYASKRYAEAATQFEKSVEKREKHFLSHYLLDKSYAEFSKSEKKNFYGKAEKSLRKALELKPDRKDVRDALSEVIMSESKFYYQRALADTTGKEVRALCDSAIAMAKQALVMNDSVAGGYGQIARIWNKLDNLDSSIYYWRLQLQRTPNDQNEFARLVNALQRKQDNTGLVELLKPRMDGFDWTKAKDPADTSKSEQDKFLDKFAPIIVNAQIELKNYSDARTTLTALLGYNKFWCDGHELNAFIELKRERYGAAVPILQEGVKACPDNKDLWLYLGDSYYFSNPDSKENQNSAKAAYAKASQLGSKDAQQKLSQLNKAAKG